MKYKKSRMTFLNHSFRECVEQVESLAELRAEYADKPADERRMAADWEYHSSVAGRLFDDALAQAGQPGFGEPHWPEGVLALAIDPTFAPALLTVGSIEYQLGRKEEGMKLFMQLTELPPDEPDLPEIIDKAGDFLLGEGDYERACALYAAAEAAFPDEAVYPIGLGYGLGELGRYEEAVAKARRADEIEPHSHLHLNDLGWALYEAGHLEEAEETLQRAVDLSPDDYELARNNLDIVRESLQGGAQED